MDEFTNPRSPSYIAHPAGQALLGSVNDAVDNYSMYVKDPHVGNNDLAAFLGDPYVENERYWIIDLNKPEICDTILKLAGPYHRVFFKMLELKK